MSSENNDIIDSMIIIEKEVALTVIKEMAGKMFGNMVKAVVDIEKEIIALDAGLHADEEALLIENGSNNSSLWGINLYPEFYGTDDFVEFDSMINIRPVQGNKTRTVEDSGIREKIVGIVNNLVKNE